MEPATTVPDVELACPLCGYNLRGLTEPRCPECGFAFTWAELLDAKRDRHPWLFEHARRGNARSFFATYVRTGLPWRFWRGVTPANPVHLRRLVLYWLLTVLPLATVTLAVLPTIRIANSAVRNNALRAAMVPVPGVAGTFTFAPPIRGRKPTTFTQARLDAMLPRFPSRAFARAMWTTPVWAPEPPVAGMAVVVAGWPWLTAATLMIFRASMRRAQVNVAHVLRTAVYGCDFGLLLTVLLAGAAYFGMGRPDVIRLHANRVISDDVVEAVLSAAVLCAAVATVRVSVAYGRYLRFDRPILTVLASQVIDVLLVTVVMVQLNRVW